MQLNHYKLFIQELDSILRLRHSINPLLITSSGLADYMDRFHMSWGSNVIIIIDSDTAPVRFTEFFAYYNHLMRKDQYQNLTYYQIDDKLTPSTTYTIRNNNGDIDIATLPMVFLQDNSKKELKEMVETMHIDWFFHNHNFYGNPEYLNKNGILV